MFLPPYNKCHLGFLRDILCKKKKALQNYQVSPIKMPTIRSLTVGKVLEQALLHHDIKNYLPDKT